MKVATEMVMKVTEDPRLIRDEVEVLFIATSATMFVDVPTSRWWSRRRWKWKR